MLYSWVSSAGLTVAKGGETLLKCLPKSRRGLDNVHLTGYASEKPISRYLR